MTVKVIANFGHLVRLAKEMAAAKIDGNEKLYEIKKKKHDDYKKICLEADEVEIGIDF